MNDIATLTKFLDAIDSDRERLLELAKLVLKLTDRIVKLEGEVDKLYKAQKGFGGYLLNRYNNKET